MNPIKRTDWQTKPLSQKRAKLNLGKVYSKQLSIIIKDGFKPKEFEDKWFIFYENNTLYCHRSWTGTCIYEVHFIEENDSIRATHAYVNRDIEQYNYTNDDEDIETIYWLIDPFMRDSWFRDS